MELLKKISNVGMPSDFGRLERVKLIPKYNRMPTTQVNLVLSEPRTLAGDFLHAKVLLDSADPDTVIHSFIAEVKGIGRTGWVNIHTDKIFESEKILINAQFPLCSQGINIPVGKHQFPLQVQIPEDAPSSYDSQFGTVRYQVKVVLNANTDQATCSEVFPIVVLARSFFDNVPQNVLSPIDFKDEIDFTFCTLPFGRVSIRMSLLRTAYRLGEVIEALVTINNRTRKGLKECGLHLVMKTQFEARSRYEHVNEKKLSEQLIEMVQLGAVKARSKSNFDPCSIRIPDSAPPTQSYIKSSGDTAIIAIHYTLKFTALPDKHAAFLQHEKQMALTSSQKSSLAGKQNGHHHNHYNGHHNGRSHSGSNNHSNSGSPAAHPRVVHVPNNNTQQRQQQQPYWTPPPERKNEMIIKPAAMYCAMMM